MGGISDLWKRSAHEREKGGCCAGGLSFDSFLDCTANTAVESPVQAGLQEYSDVVEVVKLRRNALATGLDKLKFEVGDQVTISVSDPTHTDHIVYNLTTGVILALTAVTVSIGLEEKLRNPFQLHSLYSVEQGHKHNIREETFRTGQGVYRIDKFEWGGSTARRTLVHLLTSDARMLQLEERCQRAAVTSVTICSFSCISPFFTTVYD